MGKNKAVVIELEGDIDLTPQSAYDAAKADGYLGTEEEFAKELTVEPVSQDKFDAIPGRLTKLTTTTEKADFHHIVDSAVGKIIDFGMEGITEQETVPGNQLFDISKFTRNNDYVINNGDGTITLKRYGPDGSNKISECCPNIKVGDRIRWSATNGILLYFGGAIPNNGNAFTVTQAMLDKDHIGFYGKEGVDTIISDIMIKISSVDASYEPYTGGIPSPNPTHPQDIKLAGVLNEETGRYEHRCAIYKNNLFDISKFASNAQAKNNGDGTITLTQYAVQSGHKLTECFPNIRVGQVIRISTNPQLTFIIFGVGLTQINTYQPITITQKMLDANKFGFYAKTDTTPDNPLVISDIMASEGYTLLPYEPHASQPFILTSDRPLTKWDKLVKRDGVWGWSVWSKSVCHTKTPTIDTANAKNIRAWISSCGIYEDAVCNLLRYDGVKSHTTKVNAFTLTNNNYTNLFITNSILEAYGYVYDAEAEKATNIANAKTALAAMIEALGGITITGKTNVEQSFIPLPDEEQELLNNLETYYGVTNVYNDQGCPMWLTYVQDMKAAVDSKFNNIKTALISLGANV